MGCAGLGTGEGVGRVFAEDGVDGGRGGVGVELLGGGEGGLTLGVRGVLHYLGFSVAVEGAVHGFVAEDGVGDGFFFDVARGLLLFGLGWIWVFWVWSFGFLFLAAAGSGFHELADVGFRFFVLV